MTRAFLLLQGPHGPFFRQLAEALRARGAVVHRVGFNAGDRAFWGAGPGYIPYRGTVGDWPVALDTLIVRLGITDIALYGDSRPVHAAARTAAASRSLTLHVFEEGYLRPWWATYERGGSNGQSRLMTLSVARIAAAPGLATAPQPEPPAHWGDLRQHILYGALYHWFVLVANRGYRVATHRDRSVADEARLYTRRLLGLPGRAIRRRLAQARIRRGGYPYHLLLMQLEHDASFRAHSPYRAQGEVLDKVIGAFATGAPLHHHLVVKAHPLETGASPIGRLADAAAARSGIAGRVHVVEGGKLAGLLDGARSVVTINSTAAQQALWRGLPVRALGRAVYGHPDFVSDQSLDAFFAAPRRPDAATYRVWRAFLLATSQRPGGYYSRRGRRQLLASVPDAMLAARDPYDAVLAPDAPPPLHVVAAQGGTAKPQVACARSTVP